MNRLEELALKLIDGELAGHEARELNELAKSHDNREILVRLLEIEAHLQSSGYGSVAKQVIESLRLERRQRIEDGVMSVVSGHREVEKQQSSTSFPGGRRTVEIAGTRMIRRRPGRAVLQTTSQRFRRLAVGASVAALVAIGVLAFRSSSVERNSHSASATIAKLIALDSSVVVRNEVYGEVQTKQETQKSLSLLAGQSVEVLHSMDNAEIVYADGTRVDLLGQSKVILHSRDDGAKRLTVVSGMIQADVAPQPTGRPFEIVTETATLEVLGTTLGVEVAEASTQLEVTSGVVAMIRTSDGRRVDVSSGQFVRATVSSEDTFWAAPFPKLLDTWSSGFDVGMPAGWNGKLIASGGVVSRCKRP